MNWYKKIAAPLPTSDNFQEDLYDDKFKGVNTNKGWKDKTPEGIRGLDEVLEEYHDDRIVGYIGAGNEGVAYQLNNGNVLKLTQDPSEYEVAQQLVGRPVNHIVNVHDVKVVQDDFEPVYAIEIEKVIPLDKNEEETFDYVLGKVLQGINVESEYAEVEKGINSLVTELRLLDFGFNDVHGHNVGKRGNEYVVFDLGGLNESW